MASRRGPDNIARRRSRCDFNTSSTRRSQHERNQNYVSPYLRITLGRCWDNFARCLLCEIVIIVLVLVVVPVIWTCGDGCDVARRKPNKIASTFSARNESLFVFDIFHFYYFVTAWFHEDVYLLQNRRHNARYFLSKGIVEERKNQTLKIHPESTICDYSHRI